MTRPARAIIDLDALKQNYQLAASTAPTSKTMAIIKANAYGHGMVEIAKALHELTPAFGVATIDEAIQLRKAGIEKPILSLQGAFSEQEIKAAVKHFLWLTIENNKQVQELINCDIGTPLSIWLKVDTGMHRLGISPNEAIDVYKKLRSSSNVNNDIVVSTHFACADELNNNFTEQQIKALTELNTILNAPISFANSPGILGWENSHADWNRAGFMLYGNSPFKESHPIADRLTPVMTMLSSIISIKNIKKGDGVGYGHIWKAGRDSTIATVTVGYGDGYPRQAASGTPVYVNNQRASLVGRVSMDMLTIDITGLENIKIGDEVELWGKNISVNEVATYSNTSGYEVLTRRTTRIPNTYIESGN